MTDTSVLTPAEVDTSLLQRRRPRASVIQLLFIPSFPLAALALFSIDVLVLYGLASWDYRED